MHIEVVAVPSEAGHYWSADHASRLRRRSREASSSSVSSSELDSAALRAHSAAARSSVVGSPSSSAVDSEAVSSASIVENTNSSNSWSNWSERSSWAVNRESINEYAAASSRTAEMDIDYRDSTV